jgi:hypothetical protein
MIDGSKICDTNNCAFPYLFLPLYALGSGIKQGCQI